jgi:hypothetical protein
MEIKNKLNRLEIGVKMSGIYINYMNYNYCEDIGIKHGILLT